jgi:acetyl-CoA/propionyl-CoA carboxylase, biotin carboxylase, biotin carboxyl carrier protein
LRKVLIASRGEIAARILRACKDAGLASVTVYADPDLDVLHSAMVDEAYALGGSPTAETCLDTGKILPSLPGPGPWSPARTGTGISSRSGR